MKTEAKASVFFLLKKNGKFTF